MRTLFYTTIATTVLFLCLISCTGGNDGRSEARREAEARAQKWWETSVARCGDDHYTKVKWTDVALGQVLTENELYQLKNATYSIKETPISEATRLNGIDWQGSIVISATAHRKRYTDDSGWSSWYNGVPAPLSTLMQNIRGSLIDKGFNKEKGQWSIDENGRDADGTQSHTKPECDRIPQG